MTQTWRRSARRGQSLVIFALSLVAFIGMVGLVIDGGNAFAQQRRTQNGADAAAEAGTTELARRAIGIAGTDAQWDSRVNQAITDSAAFNDLAIVGIPQYTDFNGVALGPVGTGSIPTNAAGVAVDGRRTFGTYFAGALGFPTFTASASATARTGYVSTVSASGLLPITFPVLLEQCQSGGGSAKLITPPYNGTDHAWPYGPNNTLALPLCSNGPGNIGWIDWTPPNGGASEVATSITTPTSPAVPVPKWYYVTQTGDVTSLDPAMDTWEGRDIYLPIFYVESDDTVSPPVPSLIGTCDTTPGGTKTQLSDCPSGHEGGTGSNQWYYLVAIASFHLDHSYIQGNHHAECNDPSLVSTATYNATGVTGGQLLDNCLIGYFNEAVLVGGEVTQSPPITGFQSFGVQLIK
jgi:Flp pilus assembly protein TadG